MKNLLLLVVAAVVSGGCSHQRLAKKQTAGTDCPSLVLAKQDVLLAGLKKTQVAVAFDEFRAINDIAKTAPVESAVYFNKYGKVRWHPDMAKIGQDYETYKRTEAVLGDHEAIAVPLISDGEKLGQVTLIVKRGQCRSL